ncbi:MAG: hypothetical protein AAF224_02595 [Pseudomonadota bacterium]
MSVTFMPVALMAGALALPLAARVSAGRTLAAFGLGTLTAVGASAAGYTQTVVNQQASVGAVYTSGQVFETFLANVGNMFLDGPASLGVIIAIALGCGFLAAGLVRRFIQISAYLIYPAAGAVAIMTAFIAAESAFNILLEGNPGFSKGRLIFLSGAQGVSGSALQGIAGALGGLLFTFLRTSGRR